MTDGRRRVARRRRPSTTSPTAPTVARYESGSRLLEDVVALVDAVVGATELVDWVVVEELVERVVLLEDEDVEVVLAEDELVDAPPTSMETCMLDP